MFFVMSSGSLKLNSLFFFFLRYFRKKRSLIARDLNNNLLILACSTLEEKNYVRRNGKKLSKNLVKYLRAIIFFFE